MGDSKHNSKLSAAEALRALADGQTLSVLLQDGTNRCVRLGQEGIVVTVPGDAALFNANGYQIVQRDVGADPKTWDVIWSSRSAGSYVVYYVDQGWVWVLHDRGSLKVPTGYTRAAWREMCATASKIIRASCCNGSN